jgi:hypothetical protein
MAFLKNIFNPRNLRNIGNKVKEAVNIGVKAKGLFDVAKTVYNASGVAEALPAIAGGLALL